MSYRGGVGWVMKGWGRVGWAGHKGWGGWVMKGWGGVGWVGHEGVGWGGGRVGWVGHEGVGWVKTQTQKVIIRRVSTIHEWI